MPRWTPEDIPWDSFDKTKLEPETLRLVKAAALTEYNAGSYTRYLRNVFSDDPDFCAQVGEWQLEEQQHGRVLASYAALADPAFDFAEIFHRFSEGYAIPVEARASVRGSRVGELLSRCIVETATSTYYTALADGTEEPLLQAICRRIAADEIHHFRMFLDRLRAYQPVEKIRLPERLKVVIGRIRETDDDELAFAYHCANEPGLDYDRARANQAYAKRAFRFYRQRHARTIVRLVLKASGLPTHGWLLSVLAGWAWRKIRARARIAGRSAQILARPLDKAAV
jgi:hypothetical protein